MRRFQGSRDENAFSELYSLNQPRIQRLVNSCLRFGAGDLSGEDIVQDVFVSVFRSAHCFRPDRDNAFRTWTAQIARNAVRRALRERRAHEMQDCGILEILPACPRASEGMQTVEDGARALPVLLIAFAAAFEKLLPRDRAILEEAEILNLPYERIAARHSMRRGTVRMVVFRARRRMYAFAETLLYPSDKTVC